MNESLSIDEIIKQAEAIREKTVKKAQSALEEVKTSGDEITKREIEVPTIDVENIKIEPKEAAPKQTASGTAQGKEEKTAVIDKAAVQAKKGNSVAAQADGKTQVINDKTQVIADKTNAVPDLKKERTMQRSFFGAEKNHEPIYSKEPPEIIERPATIKSKSKFAKTSDLQEIPTIVAVEELEKTKISLNRTDARSQESEAEQSDEGDGIQIVLDGFDDETEKVEKIDEDVAEQMLKERRKDKVSKFRLFSPDDIEETDDKDTVVKKEYESEEEQKAFAAKLKDAKKSEALIIKITAVLTAFIGLLTYLKDSSYLPSFLLDSTPYIITMLVMFAAVIAVNFKTILHGFKFKKGINSDFPIALLELIILAHTAAMLADENILLDGGAFYPFAGAFALLMSGLGKYAFIMRIATDFDFVTSDKPKYTVEPIVNTVDATIISRGLLSGEPNLKTSIKTERPTKFLDIATCDEPADKIARTSGMIMLALSAALFGAAAYFNQSASIGFNIFVCAASITVPCCSLFCTNNTLHGVSKELRTNGAMVNGFEGANITSDANAIVLEAQDLFGARSCEIHGIKTFNGAKADDVILKTAAVITNTKSPLASVFDDVIIGKQTILPEVDGIVYEDRLGTSAWIYRKKILVGTRDLLIHHGVPVLKEEYEKKYTIKNRKILYLAVAGKLAAMFVVSYSADPQLKKVLSHLEKSGMTLIVRSADPFINEESISELFGLPDGYIRVMNTSNGRAFEKYSNMLAEKSPAYIVHNGSAIGFVSAVNGAESLQDTKKMLSVLITFGSAIGFGIVALLAFINGYDQINALSVVLFQAIWCVFVTVAAKLKRLGI